MQVYGQDNALIAFRPEYQATAAVLGALNAYHSASDPSQAVSSLSSTAFQALRSILVPPTAPEVAIVPSKKPLGRSTTTKASVRVPVKGDARTISDTKVVKQGAILNSRTKGQCWPIKNDNMADRTSKILQLRPRGNHLFRLPL